MKILRYLICMLSIASILQAGSFKYSAEEDLNQDLQYWQQMHPDRTKEDLFNELKTFFASNLYQVESFTSFIDRLKSVEDPLNLTLEEQSKDIQDTFNALKIKMNIPDEVELWFIYNPEISKNDSIYQEDGTNQEEALYDGHDRRVYISENFFSRVPAYRLFSLIHELTHAQQHQQLGLRGYKEASGYDKEHEADTHAVSAIKCPVCTQLIADQWSDYASGIERSKLGYLSKSAVKQIKRIKTDIDICNAHNVHTPAARQLRQLMPREESKKSWWQSLFAPSDERKVLDRLDLDWHCSQKAQDRLSTVRFEK